MNNLPERLRAEADKPSWNRCTKILIEAANYIEGITMIDWNKAPEGATHSHGFIFYKIENDELKYWANDIYQWCFSLLTLDGKPTLLKRPVQEDVHVTVQDELVDEMITDLGELNANIMDCKKVMERLTVAGYRKISPEDLACIERISKFKTLSETSANHLYEIFKRLR